MDPFATEQFPESPREWLRGQARRIAEHNFGRGVTFLSAEEHNRVVNVWLHGKDEPPITRFSPLCYREIMQSEARVAEALRTSA